MSRFFPHSAYAEDQPMAHTILGVHVITRNFTTGAILGAAASGIRSLVPVVRGSASSAAKTAASTSATEAAAAATKTAAAAAAATIKRGPFSQRLVVSAANGSIVGLFLGTAMLAGRMYGREDIEWQDRSWRLLEHRGQMETDDWTYAGMAAGAATAVLARRQSGPLLAAGWRGLLGSAALGSVGGTVGYMVWRHGINGGVYLGEKERKEM